MLNETLDNTIIDNLEHTELTPCVVIDFIKVDRDAINEVDGVLIRLGGAGCILHSWHLNKQNIQVPCIGHVCCWCYKNLGGHIHHHPGRGKSGTTCTTLHADDTAKGLEYLGNWLINIAQTGNDKEKILTKAFEALLPFANLTLSSNFIITTLNSTTLNEPPNLFMIKTLFIEFSKKQEIEKKLEIKEKELEKKEIEKKEIKKKLEIEDFEATSALESPQTIQEYYDRFSEFLNDFFFGVIDELYQKKTTLLTVCHISSYSDIHEQKLAKTQMKESNLSNHLIHANNVWNLAIIDNINFKEKSFKFSNIYDVTRGNLHATLRMAFQAQLPVEIKTSPEQVIELTANTSLFGINQSINETLNMFQKVIFDLLDFKEIEGELIYKTNFDAETIKRNILTKLDPGCLSPSPNIVILEPGANLNSDEEILHVSEMFKEDFAMNNHSFLDIIANEAIFRRLIKCREKWPNIRPHLGQWHTSKDFCSVLIVLFSSYRLLSLASRLGVRFLDKFKAAVDYRSTARVLDLLWVAVGIAINIYIKKIGISLSDIMDDENDTHVCLKIWYLYYKWAAASLYASAAKSNYTTAIAHYLSIIVAYPKLEERLNYCSAFKIPRNVNKDSRHVYFGFNEVLEIFGVRFIKQNVYGNIIDKKNLRDQIKSSQDKRERIDLLMSEYLNDYAVLYSERAIKSRKESLWKLVNDLITVFGMSDPLSHQLFQEYTPTEMHKEGLSRLFDCYPNGLERIKAVYQQEVLKTEDRNPQGRRTIGVVRMKVKDYNSKKKAEKRKIVIPELTQHVVENLNETPPTIEPQSK
ncbi:hypothetical protein C1646_775049 [Rhizophagus diaphanus]|nr:hypothetical protein C1646_775049 [Rhizophagus diaphanus] [Rhizophagus sp. MUCL 43196]